MRRHPGILFIILCSILPSAALAGGVPTRLEAIKKDLENCSSKKDDLTQQRLLAAMSSMPLAGCAYPTVSSPETQTLPGLTQSVNQIGSFFLVSDLQKKLYEQSLEDLASRFALIKYFFRPDDATDDRSIDLSEILKVCKGEDTKSLCSTATESKLLNQAKIQFEELRKRNLKFFTYSQIKDEINARVNRLNQKHLQRLSIDRDRVHGWSFLKNVDLSDEHKAQYEHYIEDYDLLSSDLVGVLMRTDYLKHKIGEARNLTEGFEKYPNQAGKLEYKPHTPIRIDSKINDVEMAAKNVLYEMTQFARELHQAEKTRLSSEEKAKPIRTFQNQAVRQNILVSRAEDALNEEISPGLRSFFVHQPMTVAKTLLENPEYASTACKVIKILDTQEEKIRDTLSTLEKVEDLGLASGAATAGLGYVVYGGGKVASKLLSEEATHWATTKLRANALIEAGSAISTGDAVVRIGDNTYRMNRLRGESTRFRQASISGAGDEGNMIEARDAADELDKAATKIAWSSGQAAASATGIRWLYLTRKYGSKSNYDLLQLANREKFLDNLKSTLSEVNASEAFAGKVAEARLAEGTERFLFGSTVDKFLARLSELPQQARTQTLETLKSKKSGSDALDFMKSVASGLGKDAKRFMKQTNIAQMTAYLGETYGTELGPVVKNISQLLGVSEVEVLRRLANAKMSIEQIHKKLMSDPKTWKEVAKDVIYLAKNPGKISEFLKQPERLMQVLLWPFRDRILGTPELKKMILSNVMVCIVLGMMTEKDTRGVEFWNQMDLIAANFGMTIVSEISLTSTAAKSLTQVAKKARAETIKLTTEGIRPESKVAKALNRAISEAKEFGVNAARNTTVSAGSAYVSKEVTPYLLQSDESREHADLSEQADSLSYVASAAIFVATSGTARYTIMNKVYKPLADKLLPGQRLKDIRDISYVLYSTGNTLYGRNSYINFQLDLESNLKKNLSDEDSTTLAHVLAVMNAGWEARDRLPGPLFSK